MLDIHSHILPAIDDGARNIREALDMLRIAIDGGVKTQVLTPHIHQGRYNNTLDGLKTHFLNFKEHVVRNRLSIELYLASEVRVGPEVLELALAKKIPCLGVVNNKQAFLLEFPRVDIPLGSENLVKWLLEKNYIPVIVHPERNTTFVENKQKLLKLINMGCLVQITASSITGKFGRNAQAFTEELLSEGLVSAIASDCHNLKGRAPDLLAGYEKTVSLVGKDIASKLVNESPRKLLNNNISLTF